MSSKRFCALTAPATLCLLLIADFLRAELPQPGDIVLGMNDSDAPETLELLRGPATVNGAILLSSPWTTTPWIQSVEFDNHDGVLHNVRGNLLAVDFGTTANGGQIFSLGTTGSAPLPMGQIIGNTKPAPDSVGHTGGVTRSRLVSVAASPDNTKVSVVGYDTGSIIVYDYTAGNGLGSGASLSGGRESAGGTLTVGGTSAATWLDDDTIIAFGNDGNLLEVDPATMGVTDVGGVFTPFVGSNHAALAYNPEVSPYLYAGYSGFTTGTGTVNMLYVFDPANAYGLVKEIDLSASLQTAREMALDADGNLFIGAFGGAIEFLPAANVLNPATLTDDSTVDWYDSENNASFTGLDIGFGELIVDFADGDFDEDGDVDGDDLDDWKTGFGKLAGAVHGDGDADADSDVDGADFLTWQRDLGSPPPPPVAAVPEPASASLLLLSSALVLAVRRRTCH